MPQIRPVRPGDEAALAEICLRTADAGADATGILSAEHPADDELWAELFVLPYAHRHPDLAFVVEDAGRVVGYCVCAPDTDAFEEWFRTSWWPRFAGRWPAPPADARSRRDDLLRYAYGRRGGVAPWAAEYPAHLHIDLLPELQGQGWGRRLIDTVVAALQAHGVPGLHLVATAENTGAVAFYPRVGFTAAPSPGGSAVFTRRL